ncbi:efflux transporter outer membrane subunit [Rubripirellula obstinata]|nr:efflux transporter outer membrane subunit [Rubripirellula obstinata]
MTEPLAKRIGAKRIGIAITLLIATFSTVGCQTVGPDYGGVTSPAMSQSFFQEATRTSDNPMYQPTPISWDSFGDMTLQGLIARAMQDNPSVEELSWRINEARNVVRIVSGQADPFADGIAGYERRKRSANAQPFVGSNGQPFNFLSVGLNSRWEIDLVGRIARETEAAVADYQATQEDLNDLRRVLAGDIARAYVTLRLNQELYQQNETNLKIQQRSVDEVQGRIEAGKVGKLDLVQLQSRIGLTESDTPVFEQAIAQSFHLLALLVGSTPGDDLSFLLRPKSQLIIPAFAPELPANLIRRRPDVRRTEREVAAACARIGVAEAEFYPRLNLLGTLTFDSRKLSNLLDYDSLVFAVGPGVSWNILSLGRIESQVNVQKAQLKQACARYRQSVLLAVSEVEDALVAQDQQRRRINLLTQTVDDAAESVELAIDQYKADKASLERVVSNQQRLLQASLALAQARAEASIASVNLYQAIGGGDVQLSPWQCAVSGCMQ